MHTFIDHSKNLVCIAVYWVRGPDTNMHDLAVQQAAHTMCQYVKSGMSKYCAKLQGCLRDSHSAESHAVVAAAAETAFTLTEVKAGTPGRPSVLAVAGLSAVTLAVRLYPTSSLYLMSRSCCCVHISLGFEGTTNAN